MNWLTQAQNREFYHVYDSDNNVFLAALKIASLNSGRAGTQHPRRDSQPLRPLLPFTLMLGGDKLYTNTRKQTND